MITSITEKQSKYPIALLLLSVVLSLATFVVLILLNFWAMHSFEKRYRENEEIITLRGEIMRLDEVLTMSAWMAATTGNSKWKQRYLQNEPVLDVYIKKVMATLPTTEQKKLAKQTDSANMTLVRMEHVALELAQQQQLPQAQSILASNEYQEQKEVYAAGMDYLSRLLDEEMHLRFTNEYNKLRIAILLAAIIASLLLVTWITSHQQLRYWRIQLEKSNRNLDELVQERTAQLQAALEGLKHSQKSMIEDAKGAMLMHLSAGVVHEINNPLSIAISNIQTLESYLVEFNKVYEGIQGINLPNINELLTKGNMAYLLKDSHMLIAECSDSMGRIRSITTGLWGIMAPESAALQWVDVNGCLESALSVTLNQLKHTCQIHKNLAELPLVYANPEQLIRVFVAILLNAAESIENTGIISISTEKNNNKVLIHVKDTGSGVRPENLDKIFIPFFTTKASKKNLGFSLAMVKSLVEHWGGEITVDSVEGEGSCFTILLPIKEKGNP